VTAYVPPRYITLDDLYNRFGEGNVARLLDHDGDSEPDQEKVVAIIEEASGAADAYLYASFGGSVVERLREDVRFRSAVCDIAISLAGEQKPEFGGSDGERAPYAGHRKRGEEMLKRLGQGAERMGAEVEHGANPVLRGRVSVSTPVRHVYAQSRTNPRGSGGF
jgi:phage gp36-like protein